MTDHHFFFSYSRVDNGAYLDKFFEDLRTEVYKKVGRKEITLRKIAFRDQSNISVGAPWSWELTTALNESRTLVCVYSPAYFRSEYCGKEVQVFRKRIERASSPGKPSVIIPVLWENPSIIQVPKAMSGYQYSTIEDTGELYAQKGLNYIIKINKYRDEYTIILDHLATKIASLAQEASLPSLVQEIDMENVPNYFTEKDEIQRNPRTSILGPRTAQFIFVAGKQKELFGIKEKIDNYGLNGWEWRPFDEENEIGIIAQNIATSKRMHFSTIDFDTNLIAKIKDAEISNSLVIIIVDPWSVSIRNYKEFLSEYDNTNYVNSGLLIPWNLSDNETEKMQHQLKANLYQALSHCIAGSRSHVRDEILSLEELMGCISTAIDEAYIRIMKFANVFHKIEGSKDVSLPSLTGPE